MAFLDSKFKLKGVFFLIKIEVLDSTASITQTKFYVFISLKGLLKVVDEQSYSSDQIIRPLSIISK